MELTGQGKTLRTFNGLGGRIEKAGQDAEIYYETVLSDKKINVMGNSTLLEKKSDIWQKKLQEYENRRRNQQKKAVDNLQFYEMYHCEFVISTSVKMTLRLNSDESFEPIIQELVEMFFPGNMKREILNLILLFADKGPDFYRSYYGKGMFIDDEQKVREVEKINELLKQKKYQTFEQASEEATNVRAVTLNENNVTHRGTIVINKEDNSFIGYLSGKSSIRMQGSILEQNRIAFSTESINNPIVRYIGDLETGSIKREGAEVNKNDRIVLEPLLGYGEETISKVNKIFKTALKQKGKRKR